MTPSERTAVLLVDDDPRKRTALRASLDPLGCTVVEADSGRAALRCLMERDFAVILLDVRMPAMDGFETASLIRQRARSEQTPIIFITSFTDDELDPAARISAGAVDFLMSPIRPDELRAKVAVFTGLFSKADELAVQAAGLQVTADKLRRLTDAAPIGIFQTDAGNRYTFTNPHWSEITGIAAPDALGRLRDSVFGPARADGLFELHRSGEPDVRVVRVVASPLGEDGSAADGCVGTLADVTAEAGAEAAMAFARDQATEASRMKSDFLANMSHEIRTPMNGVIGMTDLLLETELSVRQRDFAQTVRNSGEALLTIIDDILDFSKVEVGKLEVEAIAFDPRGVIEDVAALLAGAAQAKDVELVVAVDRGIPVEAVGDPGRLRQVLTNLLGNAIKFTHAGEIVVRAGPADGGAVLRFEITDTGDGIAEDKLDRIFEPFVQADTSTSRRYGGSGLGLSISSQLVTLMGGDCGVSSRLGSGSEFWFTIPAGTPRTRAPLPTGSADLEGIAVLVVDGSEPQREAVSSYLREWSADVTTAADGAAALTLVRERADAGRPFRLVVAAASVTGTQSLALPETIAAEPMRTASLVVLTTHADGGRYHVSVAKPVRRRDLLAAVRRALHMDAEPKRSSPTAQAALTDGIRGRVLIAEDNAVNRKVALAMLSGAGYHVDTVNDGVAAVAAATEKEYDAILMDCQMPILSGYEATARIRAAEGSARHTPIIALTAGARREDRERCLAEGMDSYLAKPVNKEALLALLDHALHAGATDTPSYGPILDPVAFEELRSLGGTDARAFVTDLVAGFVAESEPCLIGLRQAVDRRDHTTVSRIAHQLKGTCSQLGARRLASSCERLERAAKAGYLTSDGVDLQEIEVDYEALRRKLADKLADFETSHVHA